MLFTFFLMDPLFGKTLAWHETSLHTNFLSINVSTRNSHQINWKIELWSERKKSSPIFQIVWHWTKETEWIRDKNWTNTYVLELTRKTEFNFWTIFIANLQLTKAPPKHPFSFLFLYLSNFFPRLSIFTSTLLPSEAIFRPV